MPEPVSEGLKPVVRAEARPDFSGVKQVAQEFGQVDKAGFSQISSEQVGQVESFLAIAQKVHQEQAAKTSYQQFAELRQQLSEANPIFQHLRGSESAYIIDDSIKEPEIVTDDKGISRIKVPSDAYKLWRLSHDMGYVEKMIKGVQEGKIKDLDGATEHTLAKRLNNVISFTEESMPKDAEEAEGDTKDPATESVDVAKIGSIEDVASGVAKKDTAKEDEAKRIQAEQEKALQAELEEQQARVLEGVRAYKEITADGVQVRGDSNEQDILRQLRERGHNWQDDEATRGYIRAAIDRARQPRGNWAYEEINAMGVNIDDVQDNPDSLLKKIQEKDPTWQDDKETKDYIEEALLTKKDMREGMPPPPPPVDPEQPQEPPVVPPEETPPPPPPGEPPVVPPHGPEQPPPPPPVPPEGQKPGELQTNFNIVVAGDRDQILHKEASRKETNSTYLLEQRQAVSTDKKLVRATKNLVAGFWQRGLWGSVFREREGRWLRATVAKTGLVELPQDLLEKALKEGKTVAENGGKKQKLKNAFSNITGAGDTGDRYAARDWLVGQVAKAKAELANADPNFKDASLSDEVRKAYRGGTKDKDAMASRLAIDDVVERDAAGNITKTIDTSVRHGERRDAIQDKALQKGLTEDFFKVLLPFINNPNMSADQARELINQYCSPEGYKPAGATDALKLRDRIAGSEKDYKKLFESQFTAIGANMVQVAEVLKAQKDQLQAKGIVTNPDDPASWIAATESQDPEKHLNFNFYVAKGEMSEGGADIRKLDRFIEGKHLMADNKVGSTLSWLASWGNAHGSSEISAAAAGGYLGSLVASLAPTDWGKVRRYSALAGVPLVVAGSGGTLLIPLAVSAGAAGVASGLKEMNSLMKRKRAVEKRSSFGIDTPDAIPQAFLQKAMKKIYGHTTNAELQQRIVTQVEASKMLDGMRNSGLFTDPNDLTSPMPAHLTKEQAGQALRWLGETKARIDLTATRGNRYIKYNELVGEAVQDQKLAGAVHEVAERLMNAMNNDPALKNQFITGPGFADFSELYARVHDTYEASIVGGSLKKKERLSDHKAHIKEQDKLFKVLKDAGVSEADMGRLKKEETTKAKNRATKKLYARKFAHRFAASAATSLVAGGIVAEGRHHLWPQDTPPTLIDQNIHAAGDRIRGISGASVKDGLSDIGARIKDGAADLGASIKDKDFSGAQEFVSSVGAHIKDTTSDAIEGVKNVGPREAINHGRDAVADAYHAVRENDWSGAGDLVERTVDKIRHPFVLEGDHPITHSSTEDVIGANHLHVRFPDGSHVNGNDLTLPDGQHLDLTTITDAQGNISPSDLDHALTNMGVISEGVIPAATGTHPELFEIGKLQGKDMGTFRITLPDNVKILDQHDINGGGGGDYLPDTIRITQPDGSFRDIDLGRGLLLSDQKDVDHLLNTLNNNGIATTGGAPTLDHIVTPGAPGTPGRSETLTQFYDTHTQPVDHIEAYSYNTPYSDHNELMLYGEKNGDTLTLDMSHMQVGYQNGLNPESINVQDVIHNGDAVFAFRNPDNPAEMMLIKAPGGRLNLSPSSNAPLLYMKDGQWQIVPTSEIAKKLVNENVLQQRPDGPYPIEYENIRGTLNVGGSDGRMGDVMAGTTQMRDGKVVFQSFARIQDSAHNNPAEIPGTPGTGPSIIDIPRYEVVAKGPDYDIYDYGMSSDLSAGVVGLSYADQGESMKRGKAAGAPDNVTPLPPRGRAREVEATVPNPPAPDGQVENVIPINRNQKGHTERIDRNDIREADTQRIDRGENTIRRANLNEDLNREREELLGLGVRDEQQQIRLDALNRRQEVLDALANQAPITSWKSLEDRVDVLIQETERLGKLGVRTEADQTRLEELTKARDELIKVEQIESSLEIWYKNVYSLRENRPLNAEQVRDLSHFINEISQAERSLDENYPQYEGIIRQEIEEGRLAWLKGLTRPLTTEEEAERIDIERRVSVRNAAPQVTQQIRRAA